MGLPDHRDYLPHLKSLSTFSYLSVGRKNIVTTNNFDLEILAKLHVVDLPGSKKQNYGIMSVCRFDSLSVNRITKIELRW